MCRQRVNGWIYTLWCEHCLYGYRVFKEVISHHYIIGQLDLWSSFNK